MGSGGVFSWIELHCSLCAVFQFVFFSDLGFVGNKENVSWERVRKNFIPLKFESDVIVM